MILPTFDFEKELWSQGYQLVVGLDEAGRGPLAGPMLAGAVIFNKNLDVSVGARCIVPLPAIIRDSKTLSKKQREEAYDWIYDVAYAVGVGRVEHTEIDDVGITAAEQIAFKRAVLNLIVGADPCVGPAFEPALKPDFFLIDAFKINDVFPDKQRGVIKGDQKVFTIAAASIIAKVTRDKIMREFDKQFPRYGFAKHVGYGTKMHLETLRKYGPCEIHRKTFKPVSSY